MENKMKMPANYNVMNEEEMTYTQGGSAFGAVSALAGTAFSIWGLYNYYKGMVATRNYVAAHKGQDTAALLEGGMNTYVNYLQKDLIKHWGRELFPAPMRFPGAKKRNCTGQFL